ncbi:AAA family ATPase [Lysinibacillus sp. CD3-6]|uniref:AAA family ATPase n=1 Tax=Lysinibacillus sp. CD3-6 TaxID=2892541 RepID=UPI0011710CAA|nr:AAA family ATPase [Lysinibacillus sp. CD3-6]UED79289.1 AAA family ATPase [Lysinibacillus sp. CD3-6]
MDEMVLKKLTLEDWNQFDKIQFDFHPRITIITGANGAGKSSVLRLIARQLGWGYEEVARVVLKKNKSMFLAGMDFDKVSEFIQNNKELKSVLYEMQSKSNEWIDTIQADNIVMGKLEVEKGVFKFYVPEEVHTASYNIEARFQYFNEEKELMPYDAEGMIKGVNISSHRQPYSYVRVDEIPLHVNDTNNIYYQYLNSIQNRTLNRYYSNDESPVQYMKKSLISLAVFGEGNALIEPNEELKEKFYGFTDILKSILPKHIGLNNITIEAGEVVLKTDSGDFLIDAVSGGLGALIDLAWQVYMYDHAGDEYTVIIDEIENHLHPSMQREILPNLLNAFPKAQFIISTHSPFVVNSIKDSYVYALKYNDKNRVESLKLDFYNKSNDAFDVLKNVLGVPVTMPLWLENELDSILSNFNTKKLELDSYNQLKQYLSNKGLEEYLPEMLKRFEV